MNQLRVIGVCVASLLCSAVAQAEVLKRADLCEGAQRMPGERYLERTIEIGPDTKLQAVVEVTSKGNGTLSVGNLRLCVVDGHDDGATYQDEMAHVEFADIDGDGWKDLVVIGIVNFTDEKSNTVLQREPFTFIYRYDLPSKSFRQTYKHARFELEEGPQPRP